MNRSARCCQAFAVALLLAGPRIALAAAAPEAPRKLSEAERQAAVLAAAYLDQGPVAWWDRLSLHSPLRRLGREAALAEIEVRAGPPAGAEWELEAAPEEISRQGAAFALGFPSGVDDTLVLDLVQEEGSWKIESLRIAAEPVAEPASGDAAGGKEGGDAAAPSPPPSRRPPRLITIPGWLPLAKIPGWLLFLVGGAGALLLVAAGFERKRRAVAIPLGLAGGVIVAVALAPMILSRVLAPGAGGAGGGAAPEMAELRRLLPLRRALTQADGAVPSAAPPETRQGGVAGQVAQLWWAQNLVGGMDLRGADAVLKGFPSPGLVPLAELLRARTAFLRLEDVPTAVAYQRAAAVGVAHEGLLYESAQAFLLLGFHEHAKQFLHQLGQLGARQAGPWLALAQMAVLDDHSSEARDDFRTGWRLEPSPRADILGRPLLTVLLGDLEIRRLVHLAGAAEPVVACPEASQRAIVAPAGFRARLLGGMLRLDRGETELRVPGGCDLAPAGTPSDPAGAWSQERAEGLLARLPALLKAARTPGALAQPALRRRTEDAVEALAERRRWPDVLALTDSLSAEPASLPPSLVRLRAAALRRSGRDAEARDLLILLAKGNSADRRTDPQTLYELADLLAEQGSFDTALKLVAKADSQLPFEASGDRLRQLQMEKRLAMSSEVFHSPHFAVVYPPLRGEAFAREAARILEAERSRLQAWIPVASSRIVEVHLLPYDDFRVGYSPGMDVLGLYDGKIRVPLGDAPKFNPFVVSILTHELAHALISEATADQAPHWFQEGLAQHVEMREDSVNPIAGYRDKENLLGFPLIEPAIRSLAPALIALGYDESAWTLHYIEHRYGQAGIHRLLGAYRAGKTTDEAIITALGLPVDRFDQDLWAWAANEAPQMWKVPVVRYDDGKD
jgi:tetratricopeptide (TPR) repeat protein